MTTVVVDWKTEDLQQILRNTEGKTAQRMILNGVEKILKAYYIRSFKPKLRHIVRTGEGMPANRPSYRRWKQKWYGVGHPLGELTTGGLYAGIDRIEPRITKTRANEIRMSIKMKEPFYAELVHNGFITNFGIKVVRRPFLQATKDETEETLMRNLRTMMDGIDFTKSEPEITSTLLSYRWK